MNPGLSRKLELFAILLFLLTDSICGQITFLGATSGGVYSFGSEDLNPELLVDLRSLEGTLPNEILEVNGKFYGTTQSGGLYGRGAIFTIDADGSNYEVLFSFQDSNGRWPQGQLLYSHGALWGVTRFGGDKDDGAIYTIDLDGANFEVVHYFDESVNGAEPVTGLIKYQNQLLGLTSKGGPAFGLGTIFSIEVSTQSYELIHEFESGSVFFGTSWAALLELEGKIYGTTNREGANGYGEIFRLNPDGTGFTILHEFDLTTGGEPFGKLVYSNSKIWGTCSIGGEIGNGVIFNVELDGSNYTMVHSFNGDNGDRPIGSLAENDGFLWGTTLRGGLENLGTLFRIKIDGSDFEKVFDNDLLSGHTPSSIPLIYGDRIYIAINRGGKNNFGTIVSFHIAGTDYKKEFGFNQDLVASGISSSLIDCEGTLWGMTRYGGLHGKGILFNINRDESEFSIAHSFDGDNGGLDEGNRLFHLNNKVLGMTTNGGLYDMGVIFTINNDGMNFTKIHDFDGENGSSPYGELIEVNGTLFGMTSAGGDYDRGVLFSINIDGSNYQKLIDFNGENGASPFGNGLMIFDNKIWGTTRSGGENEDGVIFNMNINGTDYTIVYHFQNNTGENARGKLVELNGLLYGMTSEGGLYNNGTIYSFDPLSLEYSLEYSFNFNDPDGSARPLGSLVNYKQKLWGFTASGTSNIIDPQLFNYDPNLKKFNKLFRIGYEIGGGPATYSNLTIIKSEQNIDFQEPPNNLNVLSDSFNLKALASSGLPISFTSSDVDIALIEGSKVSINGIGDVIITANQLGNEDYYSAESVSQTISITDVLGILTEENSFVYPSKTSDYFSIQHDKEKLKFAIRVFDLKGHLVKTFYQNTNNIYDVSYLKKGIYLVLIEDSKSRSLISKLIKE